MLRNRGIAFKLVVSILVSCTIIFTTLFTYNYFLSRRIILQDLKANARNLTLRTVNKIETVLIPVEKVPRTIAQVLEDSSPSFSQITNMLRSILESNPELHGITVAFEPYALNLTQRYCASYFFKDDGSVRYGYPGGHTGQYVTQSWYQLPKDRQRPVWTKPFYRQGTTNVIMATYSVPFYRQHTGYRTFAGVVTADISLDWLQELVSTIDIGKNGYGFLISKNGTFVTHPRKEYVMRETMFSIADSHGGRKTHAIGEQMVKGESGYTELPCFITGNQCLLFYAPLISSGWSLGVMHPKREFLASIVNLNQTMWLLGIIGVICLTVVIMLFSGTITRPLRILSLRTTDIARGNLDFYLPPVKTNDEVGRLTRSFGFMKDELKQYIRDLTETTAAKEKLESELRIAHDIQMSIVPKPVPPFTGRTDFDLCAVLEPAREVGGDLYDFFFIDEVHLCFVIGDVADKGVPAALFMAVVQTLVRAAARDTLLPDKILSRVNRECARDNDSCMFVTMFCGILNIHTGEILYANGGHNPPVLLRSGNEPVFIKLDHGSAVGLFDNAAFVSDSLIMKPGETLFMYTDGVTEAFNADNEAFSESRLKQVVSRHLSEDCRALVNHTLTALRTFTGDTPPSDDITILVLRYIGIF